MRIKQFTLPPLGLFQFSLRAALLGVAVFSIWLGWLSHNARRQKQACERLRSLSGEPWGYRFPKGARPLWEFVARGPEWLTNFLDIDLAASVTEVRFKPPARIGRDIVEVLRDLPHLEGIVFDEAQIEPSLVYSLKELPQLRRLSFERMSVTELMIEQLSQHESLEDLCLVGSTISDKSLPTLAKSRHLKHLDVTDTRLSWSVVWRLQHLLPECRVTPSISDREHELVFTHLDDEAIDAASGLPATDRIGWPIESIRRCALQVTHASPDGLLELKKSAKCGSGHCGIIDRAWGISFQGTVHISHIRINERGGQCVDLKDFRHLQGMICEISPTEMRLEE